jgi:hypothetical protein
LIFAFIAARRIVAIRDGLPGPVGWLIVRRHPTDPTDLKYFLSNAPADTPLDDFAAVAALRWPIETIFVSIQPLSHLTGTFRGAVHLQTISEPSPYGKRRSSLMLPE